MYHLTVVRKERGWSKSELGRRTGISLSDICKLERKKITPWPAWRKRLSEVLGIDDALLFREVEDPPVTACQHFCPRCGAEVQVGELSTNCSSAAER
jgi:transcriptional regulator with XRE-family HTH domain